MQRGSACRHRHFVVNTPTHVNQGVEANTKCTLAVAGVGVEQICTVAHRHCETHEGSPLDDLQPMADGLLIRAAICIASQVRL